jgi:hypothetical protein
MPLRISKALLLLEALPLAYISFLGLMLCFGSIIPLLTGNLSSYPEAAEGLLVFLLLCAGWRIFFAFMLGGAERARAVGRITWGLAVVGAALSLVALARWMINPESLFETLFGFGFYFLVPFIHLGAEALFRNGANKALQGDGPRPAGSARA